MVIGERASNPAAFVVAPVPPLATPTVPVTLHAVVAVEAFPVNGPLKPPAFIVPETVNDPSVPTDVRDEPVTVAFNVVPVKVPAAAATVIGA